jgi:hypothetical protein
MVRPLEAVLYTDVPSCHVRKYAWYEEGGHSAIAFGRKCDGRAGCVLDAADSAAERHALDTNTPLKRHIP